MAIRTYKVTLDSKNSIAPEPVLLRQGDKTGAVVIDATLMDNGSPVSLNGLTPMFKANTADGEAVIADSTGFSIVNASDGEFTYQVPSQLGSVPGKIKIAYFSFTDASGNQSTFDIAFAVYPAADMTQESAKDWISKLEEIIDQYNQWATDAHSSWEQFVNDNKEILESIDPGGKILTELIDSRGTFDSLAKRLNNNDNLLAEGYKRLPNMINAVEYGFHNDGITNNDSIMNDYLKNNADTPLYFGDGVFIFNSGHDFPGDMMLYLDSGAELKLNSPTEIECFFSLRYSGAAYSWGSFIKGKGTINGNFKTKRIIGVMFQRNFVIEDCTLKNFNQYGIQTHYTSLDVYAGAKLRMRNVEIINEQAIIGTFGIYDNGFDNEFDNIEIQNCEKGIYTISSQFSSVHAWIVDDLLIPNSTFAETDGYNVAFSNCVSDTMRYGFIPRNESFSISVTNFSFIDNSGVYTPEMLAKYPHIIFRGTENSSYKVSNAMISPTAQVTEVDMPRSTFVNVGSEDNNLSKLTNIPFVSQYLNDISNLGNLITKLKSGLDGSTNYDNLKTSGLFEVNTWSGSGGTNIPHATAVGLLLVISLNNTDGSSNNVLQIFYSSDNLVLCVRGYFSNSWFPWKSVALV